MRLAVAALFLVATLIAGARPAAGSTLAALPATVRVNIMGLGTSYAVIASTGTVSAIGPDGALLYRGTGKTLARTNVRSVQSTGVELPPRTSVGALTSEERADRASIRRDAKAAIAESGPRAILNVPFQFSLLQDTADPIGKIALQASQIVGVKFSTNDGLLTVNGQAYRGTFELAPDDEGDMI